MLKTAVQNSIFNKIILTQHGFKKSTLLFGVGFFLLNLSGCVMTRSQGEAMNHKLLKLEDEVAKQQMVRHDLELLLGGQVKELYERVRRVEGQLMALRDSLYDDSSHSQKLAQELQKLQEQIEEAEFKYKNLEESQKDLVKTQVALKKAQEKTKIPPLKADHFALAKKYARSDKFDEAIFLLREFIKEYPEDKELVGQSNYLLGETYRKMAEKKISDNEKDSLHKNAVVHYQKVSELFKGKKSPLSEESLYKMGIVLRDMGNSKGAKAAFNELLFINAKSKRAPDAKKHLSALD